MIEPFRIITLDSGLTVSFFDFSNRYFGDFHRVCIDVKIEIPLQLTQLSVELCKAAEQLNTPLFFERRLERMGVASQELPAMKAKLMEDFLSNSSHYFSNPDFARQLLKKKLSEKSQRHYFKN